MSASAEDIARALRGRRGGKGWICRCPAHDDRHPSLSVAETGDRKTLVKCWSGCRQDDVIDALRRLGLWDGKSGQTQWRPTPSNFVAECDKSRDPMKTWRNAGPWVRDSAADIYLKRRKLDITDDEARSLRFAPSLWHWPSQSRWPAMLARVALASGAEITTHQTFVRHDGSTKAPLGKQARLFAAGGRTIGGGV
jgi:hypothetical protein